MCFNSAYLLFSFFFSPWTASLLGSAPVIMPPCRRAKRHLITGHSPDSCFDKGGGKGSVRVRSAEKGSPGITIWDVLGCTGNYTFSTSRILPAFRWKRWWAALTSTVGAAADSLSRASSLAGQMSISFFICPAGAVTTRERLVAAVGKIIHSGNKNNNIYLYRRLVSKRDYASITGHFRPLVICLHFHKDVYLSLQGMEASQHCSPVSNGDQSSGP